MFPLRDSSGICCSAIIYKSSIFNITNQLGSELLCKVSCDKFELMFGPSQPISFMAIAPVHYKTDISIVVFIVSLMWHYYGNGKLLRSLML